MSQPELVMVIEPENKFRFRYDSEKNSHGGVIGKGKTADGKKTHPTVKLLNYNGGKKVYVRVCLYALNHEKHVLEIKGKNARDGMYYEDLNVDFTATFTSLAIMSKKKEEVMRILMDRKIESIGRIRGTVARAQLEKKYETSIKEKAKNIMNSAVLCFEAFAKDNSSEPICQPLFSGPIYNQKSSEKGTLKIYHMSHYSGSWKGGDTVILLCDKVQKGKVKVHFYEMDNEVCQWEDYAKFTDADVHYQVAITFKTPPFRGNIEKEVNVCLIRDEERSNSVNFLFRSDKNNSLSPSKKRKWNIDFESENLPTPQSSYSMNTPSPSSSSNDYSSDNHIEQMLALGSVYNSHMPQFKCPNIDATHVNTTQVNTEDESLYPASLAEAPVDRSFQDDMISGMDVHPDIDISGLLKFCEDELGNDSFNLRENPEFSIVTAFPVLDELTTDGPAEKIRNQGLELCDSDSHDLDLSEEKNSMLPQSAVFLLQSKLNMSGAVHGIDGSLEKHMSNLTLEGKEKTVSITSPILKCMKQKRTSSSLYDKLKEKCLKLMSVRDECGNSLLHEAVLENKNIRKVLEMSRIANCDIVNVKNRNNQTAMHIAVEKNDFRILGLLLKYDGNPSLKDQNGNGCLHIAADNNYVNCMKEICSHRCYSGVNAFNYQGLTPLHISVMKGFFICLELLLNFADVNAVDKKSGRSSLHFAVDMQPSLVPVILRKHDVCVNIQDFGGNTPLHLASASARVDCVKQLLEAGADPLIRNFKQDSHISDENSENKTIVGETAVDVAENLEIKELLRKAIEGTPDSLHSDFLDDTLPVLDPVTEEKLCQLLDPEKYKNLAECIGMDKCYIGKLIKLNPSPTQEIFKCLKRQYKDQYIHVLESFLEIAGLHDALKIIKERQY